jgi:polysaccharide biosynthesis protein PelC
MVLFRRMVFCLVIFSLAACATTVSEVYRDPNMDFGSVRTVAVMPFVNLSRDQLAGDRVRDVFVNALLATGAVYVLPAGEIARAIGRVEISNPAMPSPEEIVKLGKMVKAEAVVTGTLREYGDVRSGTSSANAISMSLQMIETETGKVVWTAASTKGGITIWDRLFGGGGQPMDIITVKAVNDLINKLFK